MAHVHDMHTVNDRELLEAMFYLWERMKIVIEPTGALGAAGVFNRLSQVGGKRVGVILSGGNADLRAIAALR
jgi:threonine dehydratase